MKARALAGLAAGCLTIALASPAPAATAQAPPGTCSLPGAHAAGSYGSGDFGRWAADRDGLPVYEYGGHGSAQLNGTGLAASQLGNDHIVADAYQRGYTQLWSQDLAYEWANQYDGTALHYSGGYGYLHTAGQTISTLYDDHPADGSAARAFGTGYFWQCTRAAGLSVNQYVYAPFGHDPLLLHDVVLRNLTGQARQVSWYEYWDVNPFDQSTHAQLGLAAPRYHAAARTLTVAQTATAQDPHPLTIFAAAIHAPVSGFDTSTRVFFGRGTRQDPAEVAANWASDTIAKRPPAGYKPGHTLMVLKSPVRIPAHSSVTLRYAYGIAHATAIGALVHRYQVQRSSPLAASSAAWRSYLPRFSVPGRYAWLGRELSWDAYLLRSGTTYSESCGHQVIAQGGYYQYGIGWQGGYRDQLQIMLPVIYSDPALARQILLYSAQEQSRTTGAVPQLMFEFCTPSPHPARVSDDLEMWLMLAASEYGLATRDFSFFNQQVPFRGGGHASLWDHLKLAFRYQESWRGAHGEYRAGRNGDWADGSAIALGMRESDLLTAQLAYVYPRMAELATDLGDHRFASQLDTRGAQLLAVVRANWEPRGWYARGWSKTGRIGHGVIYGEPQPWAILAGAPNAAQSARLVASIRRYLTGIGAPQGPSRIGSTESPAADDPGVTEHSGGTRGTNSAVYPGDTWASIDGWLTWSLGSLTGTLPAASADAFSEFTRDTLANHATVFPRQWVGVLSSDDVCNGYYEKNPAGCGLLGLKEGETEGLNMEPAAWTSFDAIKLAGLNPTAAGYVIDPELPQSHYSLDLPTAGITKDGPTRLSGYFRLPAPAHLQISVRTTARHVQIKVNGHPVPATLTPGYAHFTLTTPANHQTTWQLTPTPTS